MIAHSVETARRSGLFDSVFVSTDSEEIATVAQAHGADAPFLRPKNLADDQVGIDVVVAHMLMFLKREGRMPEYCCCVLPTAPFLQARYLRAGHQLIMQQRADTVMSVASFSSVIFRALKMDHVGRLQMFWPDNYEKNSQDFPEAYYDAGQFYWLRTESFLSTQLIYAEATYGVRIPRYLVQDIDTPEDWEQAELLYEVIKARQV